MKKSFLFLLLILLSPAIASAAPLDVFVSILPQKYFLKKIGGDLIHVLVMVSPGASPATYEPKPKQMVALSRSKAYFSIGVPFEKVWLPRIAGLYKKLPIIQTDKGIAKKTMWRPKPPAERGEGLDPHIWTSPPLVMLQARTILDALSRIDPSHSNDYETNYRHFIDELVDLDLEIRKLLLPKSRGKIFFLFHPSWGYFAETYGLRQIAIEREGKPPGPGHLKALIDLARKAGVKAIFIQPQFSRKSARIIARAIGAHIILADPLAEDWANNLKHVAIALRDTLQ